MRRSPRLLLAWVAAVVVMLATARIVTSDLGALHRRAHDLGADITVVLAARDLPLGATVTAADLRLVRRPSTTVAADVLRAPGAAVGRVVAVALLRDDPVGARHLAPAGAPGLDGVVPAGRRAVHVVSKDGFRPPTGAVVDVLATYDPSLATATGPPGRAEVVAQGAQVLADAPAVTPADAGAASDASGTGVTLLVTETEARSVAYAASLGAVSVVLAPIESACCSMHAS